MRNSDLIFFSIIIGMLLLVLFIVSTGIGNNIYIRFWWILALIIVPKLMYMLGNRWSWVVKLTTWLESTNNPVHRYIERKFNKDNY